MKQNIQETKSPAVVVLGTGSDVGKSLIAAGICRLLHRAGVNVAPFKAQNMSLNSSVTIEGGEMGRAQVLQAQACGLQPHVDMNPILLKPEADQQSQVIVQGKVWDRQAARKYFETQSTLFPYVKESYARLSKQYDIVVIEGAGSAAEMNLRDKDIVNWPIVELADASVILVADIDRGGVFAQVIGTMDLLSPLERERVKGIVINKFRGDMSLFEDGVRFIEERTGVPVLGVLPYLKHLELDQEDSVDIDRFRMTSFVSDKVNIGIILLPHMSNFTDFNLLAAEEDVAVRYVKNPNELGGVDVVIIPGSKTTIADLDYVKKTGFEPVLSEHMKQGAEIVGICGGFQMLGRGIFDPHQVEGRESIDGLGFLDISTKLSLEKTTTQVKAQPLFDFATDCIVEGYEIHLGVTTGSAMHQPCFKIMTSGKSGLDGAHGEDHPVWGTYIHGVFDQPTFRRQWLNRVRKRKGLPPLDVMVSEAVSLRLSQALDRWADHVEKHINVKSIILSLGLYDQ